MSEPLVSCLCSTYGRPLLLGESIKCFLDQKYPNKELIIVNDQVGVELILPIELSKNIRLYNTSKRFDSLGQKRNYVKSLAKGEFCCLWEDDDLSTPWRLSKSVEYLQKNLEVDCVKTNITLSSTDNKNYSICGNNFEGSTCFRTKFLKKYDYDISKSVTMDLDLEKKGKIACINPTPNFWYIYRWGLNTHHLSGISNEKQTWERSLTFDSFTKLKGEILIKPEFKDFYWEDIAIYLGKSNVKWKAEWEKNFK